MLRRNEVQKNLCSLDVNKQAPKHENAKELLEHLNFFQGSAEAI